MKGNIKRLAEKHGQREFRTQVRPFWEANPVNVIVKLVGLFASNLKRDGSFRCREKCDKNQNLRCAVTSSGFKLAAGFE